MGIIWLLRGQVTRVHRGQDVKLLVERYRIHIRAGRIFFISSLVAGAFIYTRGLVASNDWRLLALLFGGGAILPLAVICLLLRNRERFAEFRVALSASDEQPVWLTNAAFALAGASLLAGIAGLLFGKGY